ncbi:MAG: ribosome small subunit-dependent GTPase A [Actinomycetota bacterium]|nr:ribosome small subunit-dependent GTPase A [Actinomycetota bacterium]
MTDLRQLGWDNYQKNCSPDFGSGSLGRVRRVDRGEVDVVTEMGEIRALSDSKRTSVSTAPATGDWVEIKEDPDMGFLVERVLPRYSSIVRRDPAELEQAQVMVSNIDLVGIISSADRPINIARIERFLVLAENSQAEAILILTKQDLGIPREWRGVVEDFSEIQSIETSVIDGSGIAKIQNCIAPDRTLVLLGESGIGKSSLVNLLMGEEVQQTSEVRLGDKKGRHTTVARELLTIPTGGILIDTPGIRGVGLWDAEEAVDRVFSEISTEAQRCRFKDCTHTAEPECAVINAVTAGVIDQNKLARYLRLREELQEQAEKRNLQRRKPR